MTEKEFLDADEFVKKSIEDAGGIEAWLIQGAGMDEGFRRFNQGCAALMEKRAYKRVAMKADGLLGAHDTVDEALDTFDDLGLRRMGYFLKFLDPTPMII